MRLSTLFFRRAEAAALEADIGPDASPTSSNGERPHPSYAKEAAAVLLLASALYSALALGSFEADPMQPALSGADWVGPVGAFGARLFVESLGVVSWLVPVELVAVAFPLLSGRTRHATAWRLTGDLIVAAILAALVRVALPDATAFGAMPLGGAVGEIGGEILRALFSTVGSYIIGSTVVVLILVQRSAFSFIRLAQRSGEWIGAGARLVGTSFDALGRAWMTARRMEAAEDERARAAEPEIVAQSVDAIIAQLADDSTEPPPCIPTASPELGDAVGPLTDDGDAGPGEAGPASEDDQLRRALLDVETPSPIAPVAAVTKSAGASKPANPRKQADPPKPVETPTTGGGAAAKPRRAKDDEVRIVDTSSARKVERGKVEKQQSGFRLPLPEMLDPPEGGPLVIDEIQLKHTAQLLEKTLADYGVSGKVEEIHPGPTVTTFEVSPAAGTKVSKVAGLADDLALGLSRKVRIIAPIPGKNRIGFEIPNEHRMAVNMRELIEDRRFQDMRAPLPCVLGRDIVGAPFFADLHSMPHMIVAGATGAGKSVGLNVILVSLLTRRTPDELRLLMVDPKVVELAPFDGIPHMLLPVVTDMKQASNALRWAVDEMERRYQLFANAGTRNVTSYNGWVDRVRRGEAKPPAAPTKVSAIGPDGLEVEVTSAKDGTDAELPTRLPYIVIVIDEFADLMMQQGKDVEVSVARLAQKARAAGMHVILATQRPSVDVITGMIKANFPTRMAFRVAQKVDSRTILDEQGAEHLLGRGDMLVKLNGSNETRRVQCPFCSEEEVQRVTDHLRAQGTPVYDESILKPRDEDGEVDEAADAEADPMYDQAVRIVAETRRCSTSWIQRKLGIGYNRAAKIVETMERRGLVGPANGAKDREILIEAL